MNGTDPFNHKEVNPMKCTVEYMFKAGTRSYTVDPMMAPFNSVDEAIEFISSMLREFKSSLEWMYIHLV